MLKIDGSGPSRYPEGLGRLRRQLCRRGTDVLAGPGALGRAKLALEIVKERLEIMGVKTTELRLDLIGVNSIHGDKLS